MRRTGDIGRSLGRSIFVRRSIQAAVALLAVVMVAAPASVWAAAVRHRNSKGQTLSGIAAYYYGNARFGLFIAAASGLAPFGHDSLETGKVLSIPTAWTYRIRRGDLWGSLGAAYLGGARRGLVVARHNGKDPKRVPPVGHLIVMPGIVHVRVRRGSSVVDVARTFRSILSRKQLIALMLDIKHFNGLRSRRFPKSGLIDVPLFFVRVRPRLMATELVPPDPAAALRVRRVNRQVRRFLHSGEFAKAASAALRGLADAELAPGQGSTLYVFVTTAFVALEQWHLAKAAARQALRLNPSLSLDPKRMSPKILRVFHSVRGK
ncbi:MAG: hypothetical protein J7M25_00985 [Deltaproteobacteria bacterium]|nr:hypothetical protein [Deltaproteobacteria bacterium]